MSRPSRHPSTSDDFKDPLDEFASRSYSDPLEEALAEQPVADITSKPVTTLSPQTTIGDAMKKMEALSISCVLIMENDRLVGVFTERDIVKKVAHCFSDVQDHPISEVMTPDPMTVYETDRAGAALCVIAHNDMRHVPVLDVDQKLVGVVSPRRVTAFLQSHFADDTGCCE